MRKFIVTCGYLGTLPIAGGTYGSAFAAAVWLALVCWTPISPFMFLAPLIVLSSLLSIWLCPWAEREFGRKDPQAFVLDELAGQWVALLFMPSGIPPIWLGGASFFLFRVFDVAKPFPIRRLERLPAGWGILADDLLAGVYANVALHAAAWGLLALGWI